MGMNKAAPAAMRKRGGGDPGPTRGAGLTVVMIVPPQFAISNNQLQWVGRFVRGVMLWPA